MREWRCVGFQLTTQPQNNNPIRAAGNHQTPATVEAYTDAVGSLLFTPRVCALQVVTGGEAGFWYCRGC